MRPLLRHKSRFPKSRLRQGPVLPPAAVGHNQGPPLDPATSWNAYAWRKARKAAWKTPPIEVVRRRCRRAAELGLSYHDYTAVILDRGTHPNALFFDLRGTLADIENHAMRGPSPDRVRALPGVVEKLSTLKDCKAFVIANLAGLADGLITGEEARSFVEQVNRLCNAVITDHRIGRDHAGPGGGFRKPRPGMIADLLAAHGLPPSAAVMIGASENARNCAEAAKLARFIWARDYFART